MKTYKMKGMAPVCVEMNAESYEQALELFMERFDSEPDEVREGDVKIYGRCDACKELVVSGDSTSGGCPGTSEEGLICHLQCTTKDYLIGRRRGKPEWENWVNQFVQVDGKWEYKRLVKKKWKWKFWE